MNDSDEVEGMEWVLCSNCFGCGEGQYEGSRCYVCKGLGEVLMEVEDADTHVG